MGREGSPLPNSTRVRDGNGSLDDLSLFSLRKENYGSSYLITLIVKKLQTKTEMNEVNEVCSWQRHEVSNKVNT
jgi:hypothetical protein